jgi:signal transduction histidine kinase/CheY-like chemotaxis protein
LGSRGIFAASLALVILLAILSVGFAYNQLENETNSNSWVAHTHDVIEQNQYVVTLIQRAENAQRAFIISNDPAYLGNYQGAIERLPTAQATLARLASDNPSESARIATLNQAVSWRAQQLAKSIELARYGDLDAAKAATLSAPGDDISNAIRLTSDAITTNERGLLEDRVSAHNRVSEASLLYGLLIAAISLITLVALAFYQSRVNVRLVKAIDETAQANAERERAEQRLREAQRMEAMGQLTGGVAHDFNNLLQVIRGNLELLAPNVARNEAAKRRLESAIHGADRAADLTRQLLAFARRQPLAAQAIDVASLIADMSDILRRMLGETIVVKTAIAPDLWSALADPAQTESALLNLAINARDAMPKGGSLTIEAANASLQAADLEPDEGIEGAESPQPGDFVALTITDTGQGMSPETRARAFEPFFTTKSDGKGSGLGLSMVYGFVRQSNGHMRLESEEGRGTTVRLYLPRARIPERVAVVRPPRVDGERRTILVVEDDAAVRATTMVMLDSLGYDCLEAADAKAAVDTLSGGAHVDLVFSDVTMPGPMRTAEMAERIHALAPDAPILFASGYPKEEMGEHLDAGAALLAKPFAREDLAARISELLGIQASNSGSPAAAGSV